MHKPERLRASVSLRNLVEENQLKNSDLVLPLFLHTQKTGPKEISSMPGVSQWSVNDSLKFLHEQVENGLRAVMLFGVIDAQKKSAKGEAARDKNGPVLRAIELYKKEFGDELVIFADNCFCEYTDHGHCGTFDEVKHSKGAKKFVRNREATLKDLGHSAVAYAQAGADIIAPSGMVDGMVGSIRAALDAKKLDTAICSYAVKYASAFYGPFRDAANNTPLKGTDRKAYQMNPANRLEALREVALDEAEGADLLLVKPGNMYLDILYQVASASFLPVGAYQVSGEYSAIMAACQKGWLDEEKAFVESLVSLKRAGAQFILSYWAPKALSYLAR